MRFFTREWASCADENQSERTIEEYQDFISSDTMMLKNGIASFHQKYDLRGSLIDKVRINLSHKIIEASFVTGSEAIGYRLVKILYAESNIRGVECEIDSVLNDRRTKIWYDEFESTFIQNMSHSYHRILLTPKGEIEIEFDSMKISETKISSRTFTTPVAIVISE